MFGIRCEDQTIFYTFVSCRVVLHCIVPRTCETVINQLPPLQTESLKYNLKTKVTVSELEDTFDKPNYMQHRNMYEAVRWVKDNTTLAINALEAVSYLIKSSHSEQTIRRLFDVSVLVGCTLSA